VHAACLLFDISPLPLNSLCPSSRFEESLSSLAYDVSVSLSREREREVSKLYIAQRRSTYVLSCPVCPVRCVSYLCLCLLGVGNLVPAHRVLVRYVLRPIGILTLSLLLPPFAVDDEYQYIEAAGLLIGT
jgi:hypothetical protein